MTRSPQQTIGKLSAVTGAVLIPQFAPPLLKIEPYPARSWKTPGKFLAYRPRSVLDRLPMTSTKWMTVELTAEDHATYLAEAARQGEKQLRHVTLKEVAQKQLSKGAVMLRNKHRARP